MGRHSRKGRAPKGDTSEKKAGGEKPPGKATAGGPGNGRTAAPRPHGGTGSPGMGGPGTWGTAPPFGPRGGGSAPRGDTGPPPDQGVPRSADGTPAHGFPRISDGTPAQGRPRFADGASTQDAPRFPDGTPAHGFPRLPDTPAHGFPRHPDGAPAQGVPQIRGGHPEQRERGGGWGRLAGGGQGGAHGDPGAPDGRPGPRAPIPRPRPESGLSGGPQQAYLDAFDEVDDVLAPGRPHRRGRGSDGPVEAALQEKPLTDAPSEVSGIVDPATKKKAKGGKGLAFTGVAAAAVTTVLAVIVGGQVTFGQDDTSTRTQAADAGDRDARDASRSDNRPTQPGAPGPSVTPLSYDEKMGRKYELAADLEGKGTFQAVTGFDKAPGAGRKYRYRVDVEEGLGLDAELFAEAVQKTLNDDRSWAHNGGRTFERISSGQPDFVITLASPGTTAFWCDKSGLDTTVDNVSCDSAATERVMINAYRWARGSKTYGDQIHAYRQMLINHEVGHRLGYSHVTCDKDGELAPVMQQQSKFLTYDGITCEANPWAYPNG